MFKLSRGEFSLSCITGSRGLLFKSGSDRGREMPVPFFLARLAKFRRNHAVDSQALEIVLTNHKVRHLAH